MGASLVCSSICISYSSIKLALLVFSNSLNIVVLITKLRIKEMVIHLQKGFGTEGIQTFDRMTLKTRVIYSA